MRKHIQAAIAAAALCLGAGVTTAADPFSKSKPVESFDAGMLHVDKFGSGTQSLILIPGLACGNWVWGGTIAKFAPNYTVYTLTLPGFDARPSTDKKPLFATFTHDFWAMVSAHKLEKPVVIGHSLGGTLAILLAEEHPERLSAIVALDGLPVFPALANGTPKQREDMASQMAGTYAALSAADLLTNEKRYMSAIGTNKPDLAQPAATLAATSDPKAMAAWMREDLVTDLRPQLSKVTIPFLELMPYEPSDATPPAGYTQEQTLAFYKSLVEGAPKATVIPVTPSRHFLMLDQPEAFYTALEKFLSAPGH